VVGNAGYVGSVLVRHLRAALPNAELIGFDTGLFAHCLTGATELPEACLDRQVFGDVREFPAALLDGVSAVVCLAAVSNDPMGKRFEAVTDQINHQAAVRLAQAARDHGVRAFAYASSCSVYGAGADKPRREGDALAPLTAYARSKIDAEAGLARLDPGGMSITCLRFATACGMSDRLRLDLVLNDFVACATVAREISVLSDGTPWRPLIDVSDMARATEWAINRPASQGGAFLAVNVGADGWNFQVGELAQMVAREMPGTKVSINRAAEPDKRSYQVDFGLFASLAPAHQPRMTLAGAVRQLRLGLESMGFADRDFRNSQMIRMRVLDRHIAGGRLLSDLRWVRPHRSAAAA